jgi:hypothetical protein
MRKSIYRLERHLYAPEMNKLWYTDGTYDSVPQCTTLEEAEKYIQNYYDKLRAKSV